MNIDINTKADITTLTVSGEFLAQDIISAIREFYRGETTINVLWDFSRARFDKISSDDVRLIADTTRDYGERRARGKTALVFSADLGYGLGRMFGTLQEVKESPVQNRSFRSTDEAVAWFDDPTED